MKLLALLALACSAAGAADFSGQLRPEASAVSVNARGPVAAANGLLPGTAAEPASGTALQTELRASGAGLTAVGTLRQERREGSPWRSSAWFNELYAAAGEGGWQWAAGKRIVGWDVGYGFRPNDVVQQETRRQLLASTAEGRSLLMAEYFDASTAWALVWVNPTKPRTERGAQEPAWAARWYARDGAVDWHAFARWGAHTGASAGGALAWVASDALELHASVRVLHDADTLRIDNSAAGLLTRNPWVEANTGRTAQMLLGGTWTTIDQLSFLVEAWWDGTALPDAEWRAWNQRNQQLLALQGRPVPRSALAGNLAWQASAFNAASNLRRANVFARTSWTVDHWQPALDLLFTPADAGRVLTASLGWQGDRTRVDAGWRRYGGPSRAVLAQLPTRELAFVAVTVSF